MANVIKIKRKPQANGAGVPNGLSAGELAFSEADAKLFYGLDTAGTVSPIEIAGSGYVLSKIASSAGSGLLSNGTGNTTSLHVGSGDGISVSDNAIAVNNTVVRTTGDQSISGVKTFNEAVYLDSFVQFKGTGLGGNSLYFDYDSGGSVGLRTEILGQNSLGAWKDKALIIENGTVGNITLDATFATLNLWGASGVNMNAPASSSSGTNFATFVDYSNGNGIIKTRTAAQVKSDIGLGNVENLALSGITFSGGSGLTGGGTLAANRTFNIGQGDGISVSDDAIAVNSTVVRTTGTQTINGSKTFGSRTTFNSGISIGDTENYLTGNALIINWGDGGGSLASFINNASQLNNSINLNAITTFDNVNSDSLFPFIINPTGYNGYGAVTQGFWRGEGIQVDRGGTGRGTYSNGQLLIGSGTSLAANTLTAGTGISIANGSGTITINNSRTGSTSIVVSGLEYQRAALTGDVTASQNNNATTIANDAVTNAKAANMAVNTIKGRITTGTGDPEDLTAANVRTIINVADGANNYAHPTGGANTTITAANLKVLSAITVNTLGHVTSVSSKDLTPNDIPTLNQNTTGNAGSVTNGVYTTGDQTINGAKTFGNAAIFNSGLSANSQKITNLGTPTADSDAATKAYVDAARSGLDVKQSVRFATTTSFATMFQNYSRSGNVLTSTSNATLGAIDNVSMAVNDRILVKNETGGLASNNGIYVITSLGSIGTPWVLTRAADADSDAEVTAGMFVFVTEGDTNADTGWVLTTNDTITLSVTTLSFAQFSGAGQIITVSGLGKNGNNIGLASAYGDSVNPYGSKTANTVLAAPNGSAGVPSFRSLVSSDIPSLGSITNAGAIGSAANLPIITTTNGVLSAGSFGTAANTFCQGDDSRLSNTRNTTQSLTVNNGGGGTASSFTFNGGTAQTISYNSIGAPSISGANATGTWNISVSGNAATVTSGVYTNGSYSDPSWLTLSKSKVGLGNVENTALSSWTGSTNLTTLGTIGTGTWGATTIAVNKGGTGQTTYSNGQLLIGSGTGLASNTLTQGTGIVITNGSGTITINHNDTSTLNGLQGGNGISSITVDELGHVTAVGLPASAYLTSGTVCAAIVDCTIDGGTFS